MKTLLLTQEQVASLSNMKDVIQAVEDGYKAYNSGRVMQPDFIALPFEAPRGELDIKAGVDLNSDIISMKASSGGFNENPEKCGLPAGINLVVLWDAKTSAILTVMDGSMITGYRTGAAGAVSVKYLAREDARVLTIISAGKQARNQVRAIREVHPIEQIVVNSRTEESMNRFKRDIESEFGIPVEIEPSKEKAVRRADILATVTRGKGSVVEASWVKPGTHVICIGTDMDGKQEVDSELFRKATIIVDAKNQTVPAVKRMLPLKTA